MFLGPYNLYDIISVNEEPTLEITTIVFDLDEKLYHHFHHNHLSLQSKTIKDCIEENNAQVESINFSIAEVRLLLKDNPDSTKRKTQLEYLSNTLDHFVNWYKDKKVQIPDKPPLMEWNKGTAKTFESNPVTVLMTDSGSDGIVIREYGNGKIMGMSHAGNWDYPTLSNTNIQQLYINAINWAN